MEHDPDAKTLLKRIAIVSTKNNNKYLIPLLTIFQTKRWVAQDRRSGQGGKTWMANTILCWTKMGGNISISTAMSGKQLCESPFF